MDEQLNGKRKILIIATIDKHIEAFHLPFIEKMSENGYSVDVASNGVTKFPFVDKKYNIPFTRNPISISNVQSYKNIKQIINNNDYDIIHCHTPVGGVIGRLAAKNTNSKVIYMAHGFHFYKGAPLKNWLIFYPIEKYLSKYTDVLITINNEDYNLAKKKFKSNQVEYIPGVGIDVNDIENVQITGNIREELHLEPTDKIILSVGELNENKNHELVIKALSEINDKNIIYLIAGEGHLKSYLGKVCEEYNVLDRVKFLNYRNDVISIMKQSNLFVFPSKREGLPVSVMEAMACNLPIVLSNIRGNEDLIKDSRMRFNPKNVEELIEILNNFFERSSCLNSGIKKIQYNYNMEEYSRVNIQKKMEQIYYQLNQ